METSRLPIVKPNDEEQLKARTDVALGSLCAGISVAVAMSVTKQGTCDNCSQQNSCAKMQCFDNKVFLMMVNAIFVHLRLKLLCEVLYFPW